MRLAIMIFCLATLSCCLDWEDSNPSNPVPCTEETSSDRGKCWGASYETGFYAYNTTVDDSLLLVHQEGDFLINKETGAKVHDYGNDYIFTLGEEYWHGNYMLSIHSTEFSGVDHHNRKVDFRIRNYKEPYSNQITGIGEDFFVFIKTPYQNDSSKVVPTLCHGNLKDPQQLEQVATPNPAGQALPTWKEVGYIQEAKAFISNQGTRQILIAFKDFTTVPLGQLSISLFDFDKKEWIYEKKYLPIDTSEVYSGLKEIFIAHNNEAIFINYNQLIRWDLQKGEIIPTQQHFLDSRYIYLYGANEKRSILRDSKSNTIILDNQTNQVLNMYNDNASLQVDMSDMRGYMLTNEKIRIVDLNTGKIIDVLLPDCVDDKHHYFRNTSRIFFDQTRAGKRYVLANVNACVLKFEVK